MLEQLLGAARPLDFDATDALLLADTEEQSLVLSGLVTGCGRYHSILRLTWIRREKSGSGQEGLKSGDPGEYLFCEIFYHR